MNEEYLNESMELDGSIIFLEFAPLTKRIKVSNIPAGTSKDDVMYKFQSRIPGDQVKNVELDEKRRVADVYFENSSGTDSTSPHVICFIIMLVPHHNARTSS